MEENGVLSKRTLAGFWVILVAFVAAYLVVSQLAGPSDAATVRDIFYTVIGVVTVAVLVITALKSRGEDRPVWALIAITGMCWSFGDAVLRICEITGVYGPERIFCAPDIFYLAAYVSLAFVVVHMARLTSVKKNHMKWVRYYPFALVAEVALLSIGLALFLPQGIAGASVNGSGLKIATIVNYIYPAFDIGIVAGMLLMLLMHDMPFRKIWHELFIFGLSMFAIADMSYSLFEPAGIYDPTSLLTQAIISIWLFSYGLLIMAAVYKLSDA